MDWRETTAQTNDVPPYFVCSELDVLKMAELKPISLFHLEKIIRNQSPYLKYQIRTLLSIIKKSIPRTPDHTSAKKN
jgi:ribonuclease D